MTTEVQDCWVTRSAWLNRASELIVTGRNADLALRALKQLARLDATIAQMEAQVPEEVRDRLEDDQKLMTVAELLSMLAAERYRGRHRKVRVLHDLLWAAADFYRDKDTITYCALDIASRAIEANDLLADYMVDDIVGNIDRIAERFLEEDDERRAKDDENVLSPAMRARLEAIRATQQGMEAEEERRGNGRATAAEEASDRNAPDLRARASR